MLVIGISVLFPHKKLAPPQAVVVLVKSTSRRGRAQPHTMLSIVMVAILLRANIFMKTLSSITMVESSMLTIMIRALSAVSVVVRT